MKFDKFEQDFFLLSCGYFLMGGTTREGADAMKTFLQLFYKKSKLGWKRIRRMSFSAISECLKYNLQTAKYPREVSTAQMFLQNGHLSQKFKKH